MEIYNYTVRKGDNMKIAVSQQLLSGYASSGKTPNYALSFLLNSLDVASATEFMTLGGNFTFEGNKVDFEIDAKNAQAIQVIFGSVEGAVVEKLLWMAAFFPEI